ncbi:Hypothetical protein SRAE_2000115200 [Strongyloides ratti]|uniref:Uncharacterized protein n=1 Tax=Strongyloides ratti TaxID=34506 RepID=A0A090MY33_STRRB|nr:Hypothetical protein SRAE_2000115200 [Strongyloides ratti]CEF66484.1 Hypothetical protein SRAE_2000115200 [Strongyloides ratti]
MLGVEFLRTAEIETCNIGEKCAYLQVDIPDLMIGQVQGCSNTIFDIINDLLYDRKDFINEMPKNFIEKAKDSCDENENIFIKGKILSGDFYFYLACSYNHNYITKNNAPYLPPIPGPSENVKCKRNNHEGEYICSEGYCTHIQINFNDTMKHVSLSNTFYGCPSEYFNYLYEMEQNYALPKTFFQNLGGSCSEYSSVEKYDFYMENVIYIYQNCNPDINMILNNIPQIPNIIEYDNNIIGECDYLVNGYLSNSDEDIGNVGTLCNSEHCVTLTINIDDVNGIFMGCSSELRQYLYVINKKTSNLIESKIEEYIDICNNGGTTSVSYDDIFSMTINCNNTVNFFDFKQIKNDSTNVETGEYNISHFFTNKKNDTNEENIINNSRNIFLLSDIYNILSLIFLFIIIQNLYN